MKTIDHADLARSLIGAVLRAGAIEMGYYASGVATETKADSTPVTAADREAEAVLVAALALAAPGMPVIAEEAVAEGIRPKVGECFFLVDPLDGTREFINKRGEFTVNIALIVAGRPRFGIVYAPALGELYATLGEGRAAVATIAPEASGRAVALEACGFAEIRTREPDPSRLTAVASRSHMTPETETFLARYPIAERRDRGSSLKFCMIARGAADIYPRLGPTMEWDTAAGHAVLAAAGGSVTRVDGSEFNYGKSAEGFRNPHFVAWGSPRPFAPLA